MKKKRHDKRRYNKRRENNNLYSTPHIPRIWVYSSDLVLGPFKLRSRIWIFTEFYHYMNWLDLNWISQVSIVLLYTSGADKKKGTQYQLICFYFLWRRHVNLKEAEERWNKGAWEVSLVRSNTGPLHYRTRTVPTVHIPFLLNLFFLYRYTKI